MNRNQAQSLLSDHKKISESAINDKIKHISLLGRELGKKESIDEKCLFVCETEKLSTLTSQLERDNLNKMSYFIICINEGSAKSLICILETNNQLFGLYVDFINVQIPSKIKHALKLFDEAIEIKCFHRKPSQYDDIELLILQALEQAIIISKSDKNKKRMIENFADPQKSLLGQLKESLSEFSDRLKTFASNLSFNNEIDSLAGEKEFLRELSALMSKIPLAENAQYYDIFDKILKKHENGSDDDDEMKKLMFELEKVKNVRYKKIEDISISQKNKDYPKIDIYEIYPTQMEKFDKVFKKLRSDEGKINIDGRLKEISEKLKLDLKTLKMYFKSEKSNDTSEEKIQKSRINVTDIEEIRLPLFKESSSDSQNKKLDALLLDIEYALNGEKMVNLDIITFLKNNYQKVKQFDKKWSIKDARDIRNWATISYGKLKTSDICETIAIMDRTFSLVTGGFHLRDVQILSILSFFYYQDKGLLAQIQTGEGKTTIVAILASIKVLQGKTVDVITSNPVLAEEGIESQKQLYEIFNISVATNNEDGKQPGGARECYKADVVYGVIGNFQFDFLRDTFLGYGTRGNRKFDTIILDEVDNMIIDNASHIAKLSGPFPGMESFKYIYIKIWMKIQTAEYEIEKIFEEETQKKREELIDAQLEDDEAQNQYDKFVNKFTESAFDRIIELVKQSNPCDVKFIPSHIKDYTNKALDNWIKSALDAKYNYKENEHYIISKTGERVIQPVDFSNTGVTMKNTIWQHGLHQFLQLKHNLRLTSESLTSCFISNLSYIKKYGYAIYGLTGTLGSDTEKELISSIYDVRFIQIPTFKLKQFIEYEGEVIDDEEFASTIADDARAMGDKGRATLIICETINDAKIIEIELKKSVSNDKLTTFFFEEDSEYTKYKIEPGNVIIATNIAGRGTDLKTSKVVEENGGLHVCVAFLPCNKRVEDQAFGRTSRQGNKGTAQLLIKQREIDALKVEEMVNMTSIKAVRDLNEAIRIASLKNGKINELVYQDELFELFSELFNRTKKTLKTDETLRYVLEDLKECWAFWLSDYDFTNPENLKINSNVLFKKFELKVKENLHGKIVFNPYYLIRQAEHYIMINKLEEAETGLILALSMTANNEILYSAYMKLFEVSILQGGVTLKHFKNVLMNINMAGSAKRAIEDNFTSIKFEPNYKVKALRYLEMARKSMKNEIDYIANIIDSEEFAAIVAFADARDEKIKSENADSGNLLLKHLNSRRNALMLHMEHSVSLAEQLNTNSKADYTIDGRELNFFSKFEPNTEAERSIKENVLNSDLDELSAVSLHTTYTLKATFGIAKEKIFSGVSQVVIGVPLLIFPLTTPIGSTLVCEGIQDIAFELIQLITKGNEEFSWKTYLIEKAKSFGTTLLISIFTWGFGVLFKSVPIFQKVANVLGRISNFLKGVEGPLKKVCEKLAHQIDKLAGWFKEMALISEFSRLKTNVEKLEMLKNLKMSGNLNDFNLLASKIDKISIATSNMTRLQYFTNSLKEVVLNSVKQIVMGEIMTRIVALTWSKILESLKPRLFENVRKTIRNNLDRKIFMFNDFEDIEESIEEAQQESAAKQSLMLVYSTSLEFAKEQSKWKSQMVGFIVDTALILTAVSEFTDSICEDLNKKLPNSGTIKCCDDTEIEKNLENLCQMLSEKLFELIVSALMKTSISGASIGIATYQNVRLRDKEINKLISYEKIEKIKATGPSDDKEIRAYCDVVKKPLHICDENGNVKKKLRDIWRIKEDPVKIVHYPPDKANPNGHYAPHGGGRTWTTYNGENNCFFDAVAISSGGDSNSLRRKVIKIMQSNPQRYVSVNFN